jgi:hypothetical protein
MSQDLDLMNKENERSFYNKVSDRFKKALDTVPAAYLQIDESDLAEDIKPNQTINCLRFRLWEEYNKAQDAGVPIRVAALCKGICSTNYFYAAVLRNKKVLAYLLIPPKDYELAAEEALLLGMSQIRRILQFPLWDKDGKPDAKIANLQLSVMKMLDARVKGAPMQRIEQKTLSANVSVADMAQDMTMKDIEARLHKLRGTEEKVELLDARRPKFEEFKSGGIELDVAKPLQDGKKREY